MYNNIHVKVYDYPPLPKKETTSSSSGDGVQYVYFASVRHMPHYSTYNVIPADHVRLKTHFFSTRTV